MEILTEFDELQAALAKVNMDECVLPYYKGRLISESAFNKTQKILNCPEMISAHKYLYNLDMDQLTEDEIDKIDQLYKLGCDRGFIVDDLTKWDDGEEEGEEEDAVSIEDATPVKAQPQNTLFKAKVPCWTVIYSATKDGDIKTGEAYSNAVSINAAKADVNAKLSQCGYDNITILAIENCTSAPACTTTCTTTCADDVNEADKKDEDSDDSSADEEPEEDDSSDESSDDTQDDTSDEGEDDSSNDETSDDAADDTSDEEGSSDDSGDDSTEDEGSEDEGSEDSEAEDDEDADSSDEGKDDEASDDEASDDDNAEEDEDSDNEDDELDANEKAELRDLYRKTFKNTLVKCKFDTSFNDLTLEQKVKFFTELSKAWKKENEPQEFMTDKEIEQLNNVVAKPSADED